MHVNVCIGIRHVFYKMAKYMAYILQILNIYIYNIKYLTKDVCMCEYPAKYHPQ